MEAQSTEANQTEQVAQQPAQLTNAQLQQQFSAMVAEAKRQLKKSSKNELVRLVISQLIHIQQLQHALREASEALESSTPAAPTTEVPNA